MAQLNQELLGDCSIGFSGGLDSTSVAYMAALQKKGRVHLHTFNHGYGYPFNSWAMKAVRTLDRALGEGVIVHRYVDTRDLFDLLAMKSLIADRKKYGAWFGCCLGCTMAVITKILIYNLERRIPHAFFGSSVGGQYAVMSMPVTIAHQREYCGTYGILYSPPLLEANIVKETERQMLDDAGVFRGHRFLDKHSFGNQGYCMLSLQHLPDVLFNIHPILDPEKVGQFFRDKRPICERYIEQHFRATGQDLGAAVADLRGVTASRMGEAG
jgi:hypothetical protein